MALSDPISAYNAASNIEAHLVRQMLEEAGIEAHVVEDTSVVGLWFGGALPEIHKPQVWIERADAERSAPVLAAYEDEAERRRREFAEGDPVVVTCEACGAAEMFPAHQIDSVQSCPACGAFVDVVDEIPWADESAPQEQPEPRDE